MSFHAFKQTVRVLTRRFVAIMFAGKCSEALLLLPSQRERQFHGLTVLETIQTAKAHAQD